MESLTDRQKNVIRKIAKDINFEQFEVYVKHCNEKSDSLMGIITNIKIVNKDRDVDLILKSTYAYDGIGENFIASFIYNIEVYIYEKVFPEYDKLDKEFNLRYTFNRPVMIHGSFISDKNSFFVMNDITKEGFQICDPKKIVSTDQIAMVVKEYAKLHSLGMILKKIKPELFSEIKHNLFNNWGKRYPNERTIHHDCYRGVADKLMETIKENKEATQIVSAFLQKIDEYYEDIEDSKYDITITHGDAWYNNIMFKYEDSSEHALVKEVCLLDWQMAKISSPAADIAYFFIGSIGKEQLYDYNNYLKIYHEILSENLYCAGLVPEHTYTYSQLEDDFRKFCFHGLLPAIITLLISLGDKADLPVVKNIGEFTKISKMKIQNELEFEEKVMEKVQFMIDIGAF